MIDDGVGSLSRVYCGMLGTAGWVTLALAFVATSAAVADGPQLPASAPGFSWRVVQELGVAVPLPDGWTYTSNKGKLLSSIALTREPPGSGLPFTTGLTVSAVDHLSKTGGPTLDRLVDQYVAAAAADPDQHVLTESKVRRGRFVGIALHYRSLREHRRYYRLFLADASRDRLFMVTFASTEALWKADWPIGSVMTRDLHFFR